ncbi:MAG: mechanosensitive ion channel family protein [Hymenobacteraceae bacterium]|nr:mechanosensitive ion channel family protein [Hymenobacteraceae bacterium]MDX5395896.1 mechanosensitive ion channel family protein [Hymenobacteraceae bacterium]MDX5444222.1 mechanosensitive ion channel family protein [Hymenobacteraceae bacterium]MDX5511951.1 mechanosensitive ion channel family protein [Hymenobacteraceae bacterium]
MNDFLARSYFNNSVQDYLIALGIVLLGFVLVRLFKRVILQRIKAWTEQTATGADNFLIDSIERFGIPALYFGILYVGVSYLVLSERMLYILKIATTVVITYLVMRLVAQTILLVLRAFIRRQEGGEEKVKQLGGIMLIINLVIWGIGLLFIFANMGYDVTAAIAGLGIGGIAIALAAQNILGDLFNYFVIFFDRPFEVGDFIIIDQKMGTVDKIGIKTTRIKSLSGEQLVFSNSDLTNSRIHNYKRMERRRIVFKFGVIYQTTLEQLRDIPNIIKSIIAEHENVTFDRAHFSSYGDSSLDFEVVYIVLSSDYNTYMDIQQCINLRLFEEFQARGIEFAYPTRTLFVVNDQPEQPQNLQVQR